MTDAFALFATDCISLTPIRVVEHEKHEAVARNLKHAIPDGHTEMIHTLESGGEIFVTGRLWEPTETISPTTQATSPEADSSRRDGKAQGSALVSVGCDLGSLG